VVCRYWYSSRVDNIDSEILAVWACELRDIAHMIVHISQVT
jgi:hypothetical protein